MKFFLKIIGVALFNALVEILCYLHDGGMDLGKVQAIAYDGIYESRI